MTRRIGRLVIIEPEPPRPCELCGVLEETRPYGPGGKRICFACMKKDEPAAVARMTRILYGEQND